MHGSLAFHSFFFVSGKKKLRIQKYPDTCGRGLIFLSTNIRQFSIRFQGPKRFNYFSTEIQNADSVSHMSLNEKLCSSTDFPLFCLLVCVLAF